MGGKVISSGIVVGDVHIDGSFSVDGNLMAESELEVHALTHLNTLEIEDDVVVLVVLSMTRVRKNMAARSNVYWEEKEKLSREWMLDWMIHVRGRNTRVGYSKSFGKWSGRI